MSFNGKQVSISAIICILALGVGVVFGVSWHSFTNNGRPRTIERSVMVFLFVDDKNCDSGATSDWFNSAKLLSETGETVATLSNFFLGSCSEELEFFYAQAMVRPGSEWVYRLALFTGSEKTSDRVFKTKSSVSNDDIVQVRFSVSTDCTNNERFCDS